jgi:hypothetical protein
MTPMRGLALPLALIALAGCAGPAGRTEARVPSVAVPAVDVKPPDLTKRYELALVTEDDELILGNSSKAAMAFLPRPPKAFDVRVLPEGMPPGFRAKGWESDSEGFAVVLYGDEVALALRTLYKSDSQVADELVQRYSRRFRRYEPVFVGSRTTRYWFFQGEGHRLAICASTSAEGEQTVTVALGTDNLMDAFRFSKVHASKDGQRSDRQFSERAESL